MAGKGVVAVRAAGNSGLGQAGGVVFENLNQKLLLAHQPSRGEGSSREREPGGFVQGRNEGLVGGEEEVEPNGDGCQVRSLGQEVEGGG